MLTDSGRLYVMDSKYPICDIRGLDKRLRFNKLTLEPVPGDKIHGLYKVVALDEAE